MGLKAPHTLIIRGAIHQPHKKLFTNRANFWPIQGGVLLNGESPSKTFTKNANNYFALETPKWNVFKHTMQIDFYFENRGGFSVPTVELLDEAIAV